MEIKNIVEITYELFRIKQDRIMMDYEDQLSNFSRRYEKLKTLYVKNKDDYDLLLEKVREIAKGSDKPLLKESRSSSDLAVNQISANNIRERTIIQKNQDGRGSERELKKRKSSEVVVDPEYPQLRKYSKSSPVSEKIKMIPKIPESAHPKFLNTKEFIPPNQLPNERLQNDIKTVTSPPTLKCVEVVRKKGDREALRGFQCDQCAAFYNAQIQQGVLDKSKIDELLKKCSRHRGKWTPPETPEGFWDLTIRTPDEWKK